MSDGLLYQLLNSRVEATKYQVEHGARHSQRVSGAAIRI